jgi:hypothetical protein
MGIIVPVIGALWLWLTLTTILGLETEVAIFE